MERKSIWNNGISLIVLQQSLFFQIPKTIIICDLSDAMIRLCEDHDMRKAYDGLSYYKHHENKNAYIEVISFDKLLQGDKERNKAFFDKLGLPTT